MQTLPQRPSSATVQVGTTIPPSVDPMRQRLAEAILKATTPPEGEDVMHPMQALGNAANQMAGAYLQKKLQAQRPLSAGQMRPRTMPGTPKPRPDGGWRPIAPRPINQPPKP